MSDDISFFRGFPSLDLHFLTSLCSLSLSLSHTHTHTNSPSLLSLSLSHTHTHYSHTIHTHTHTHYSHTHTHTPTHPLSALSHLISSLPFSLLISRKQSTYTHYININKQHNIHIHTTWLFYINININIFKKWCIY